MRVKRLKKGEARVIRIGEEAIRELVYETITEKSSEYFNVIDSTFHRIEISFDMEAGDLICVFRRDSLDEKPRIAADFEKLSEKIGETTCSMFSRGEKFIQIKVDDEFFSEDNW